MPEYMPPVLAIDPQPPKMPDLHWQLNNKTNEWEWFDVYYGHVMPTALGSVKAPEGYSGPPLMENNGWFWTRSTPRAKRF